MRRSSMRTCAPRMVSSTVVGAFAPGPREIEGLVRVLVARLLFGDDIGRRRGGVAVRGAPWIVHDLTDVGANRVRLRGR